MNDIIKETNELESGFFIRNIILMKSSFERVPNVNFSNEESNQSIQIEVDVNVKNDFIYVNETLKFAQTHNSEKEIECEILMTGIFERRGDSSIDLKTFGEINGAAIIFPYIRQHLSALAMNAGIGIIMLPPINFTKRPDRNEPK